MFNILHSNLTNIQIAEAFYLNHSLPFEATVAITIGSGVTFLGISIYVCNKYLSTPNPAPTPTPAPIPSPTPSPSSLRFSVGSNNNSFTRTSDISSLDLNPLVSSQTIGSTSTSTSTNSAISSNSDFIMSSVDHTATSNTTVTLAKVTVDAILSIM